LQAPVQRADGPAPDWPLDLYGALRDRGTTQYCYVPDSGHRRLIELAHDDDEVHAVPLTCEEEGVGMVVGAHLGLSRGVLLMQSSGVGNCINFLSLVDHCRVPFLSFVTMRGEFGEQNPWQFAMGQAVVPSLESVGVLTLRADAPDEVLDVAEAAIGMVDQGGRAVAVLLGQRLLGAKKF
jgi:sulfopyruvate decarboxylase TPP-binding subunit